jgi:acetate kinase
LQLRTVLAGAAEGNPEAVLALSVYEHRLRAGVAAMIAALGGLDVLVFTGGVGERAPAVRELAAAGLAFLGVMVDQRRNHAEQGDRDISNDAAQVRTLVVETREDLEIAH